MNIKEQYKILEFGEFGDERGNLVVAEGSGMDIPFDIKRVFYMYRTLPLYEDSMQTAGRSSC